MRKDQKFIHLRVHSSYSLAEGALTPQEIVSLCKKNKMDAVAITDSNNLFGSLEFSQACSNNGIQPIVGSIVNIDYSPAKQKDRQIARLLLIAKDNTGYSNLLKIVSRCYTQNDDNQTPHFKLDALKEFCEGIIVLTGNVEGPIGQLLLDRKQQQAEELLLTLNDIFKDHLYIELMRHGLAQEEEIEDVLLDLAYKHNIPIVATNDAYFSSLSMHEAHDALLCIADGRFISEENRKKVSQENYFKSPRKMKELFSDLPEAIENTVQIAQRCSVMSESRAPMLPHYSCAEGRDEADELKEQSFNGLLRRIEIHVYTADMSDENKKIVAKPYLDRLEYELDVITNMKFPGYFLIVSDFIKWSKRNNIPVGPGRGSGAGSVVAWALEITDLDPLRYGLLFERFLNPERISMPDFDIDFCQERREEVIRYVQEKYGRDKVAQIITFGKLQARAVLRDVGRVMQMSYGKVDKISKMIPFNPIDPVTLSKAIDMDRDLRRARDDDPEIAKLLDIGLKLEGLNRHSSTHAAGVVIADRPLEELVPVYRDPRSDMPVCGYSMKYAESAGLVKFDFLGLKTLTVIAKTCEFIKQTKNIDIDVSKLHVDDKETFAMLSRGDSAGVFQLESAGMRDTLKKLRPDNIEDIIALISLYRPGPMDNIPSYIARKHGTEEEDHLHPMLEGILKETHGVIIYQEQVMQIAQVMGGYSLGAADLLRRAMGKKIASEMDAQRKIFVDGAVKNGVSKEQASSIFDLVAKFAGYGFNKSHAAAYTMISYQTAYLKAHYPAEFLAASMNLEINDTDKINNFRQEILQQGIKLLLPDVNKSCAYFKPELTEDGTLGVRYGLGALKNVSVATMEIMEKERKKNGDFKDIFDFVSRIEDKALNKRQLESLIRSGSFGKMHKNRRVLYENVETILKYGSLLYEEKNSNQVSLFGGSDDSSSTQLPTFKEVPDWKGNEKLKHEFDAIGMYLGKHPISSYKKFLDKMGVVPSSDFESRVNHGNSTIKIAGVIVSKRMRSSPRGRFANLVISDPYGIFEVSIYDENLLSEARELLENGMMIILTCESRKDEGGLRLTAQSITSLEEEIDSKNINLSIYLEKPDTIELIKQKLESRGSGRSIVSFFLLNQDKEIEIKIPDRYNINYSTKEEIAAIEGIKKVIEA